MEIKMDMRKKFSLIKLSYTGPREETCFRDQVGYYVTFDSGRPNPINVGNKLGEINNDVEEKAAGFEFQKGIDIKTAKEQIDKAVKESEYAYSEDVLQKQVQDRAELFEKKDSLMHRGEFLKQLSRCLGYVQSFNKVDVYAEYIKELSQKSTYSEREAVKEPATRQKGLWHFFKRLPEGGIKNAFSQLRDEDTKWCQDFLKKEKLETTALGKSGEELIEKWRNTGYEKGQPEALAENLLKRYASSVLKDALQNKYYQQTGDIGIFMAEGEKERFEKMSLSTMLEEYSSEELLSTHKGAVMIAAKIKEAKTDTKLLAESLVKLKEFISSSKPVNRPLAVREHLLHSLSGQYQKFMPAGKEFEAVFKALEPSSWEKEFIKEIKDKVPVEAERWEKYITETERLSTGKEDVSEAKKRLDKKWKASQNKEPDISGVIVAEYIAKDLMKGYELPKTKDGMDRVVKNAREEAIKDRETARSKNSGRDGR